MTESTLQRSVFCHWKMLKCALNTIWVYVKEENKCNRKGKEGQEEIKTTRINCQVDGQEVKVSLIYCICKRGEEGFMIQCSDCNEWFHAECVRVTEQDVDQIEDYFCDTCLEATVEP